LLTTRDDEYQTIFDIDHANLNIKLVKKQYYSIFFFEVVDIIIEKHLLCLILCNKNYHPLNWVSI
jgi:hypothetical protein